ncbi:hypothetical protein DIKCMJMK_04310 [Shewanella oneidensis]|nr:hypothetical protein [Shewanella oneidensis]
MPPARTKNGAELITSEGWLYLAVIIDLYSRAMIDWSMSNRMTAQLACDALTMALFRRGFPKNVIVHSDRGSQYCSHAYRNLIKKTTTYSKREPQSLLLGHCLCRELLPFTEG